MVRGRLAVHRAGLQPELVLRDGAARVRGALVCDHVHVLACPEGELTLPESEHVGGHHQEHRAAALELMPAKEIIGLLLSSWIGLHIQSYAWCLWDRPGFTCATCWLNTQALLHTRH